jgi:hypothetical protein
MTGLMFWVPGVQSSNMYATKYRPVPMFTTVGLNSSVAEVVTSNGKPGIVASEKTRRATMSSLPARVSFQTTRKSFWSAAMVGLV